MSKIKLSSTEVIKMSDELQFEVINDNGIASLVYISCPNYRSLKFAEIIFTDEDHNKMEAPKILRDFIKQPKSLDLLSSITSIANSPNCSKQNKRITALDYAERDDYKKDIKELKDAIDNYNETLK